MVVADMNDAHMFNVHNGDLVDNPSFVKDAYCQDLA